MQAKKVRLASVQVFRPSAASSKRPFLIHFAPCLFFSQEQQLLLFHPTLPYYICRMSPTGDIQLSDAEIEALAAKIQGVSSKDKMLVRPTLQALLLLIRTSADASLFEIVCKWISEIKLTEGVVKVFHPLLPIPVSVRVLMIMM